MATTHTLIASTTIGSAGASSIEFNSIPQTYTDLIILLSAKTSRTQDNTAYEPLQLRFNASTSGYSSKYLQGLPDTGYKVFKDTISGETSMQIGQAPGTFSDTVNTFSNNKYYIPNYASSNNKSVSSDSSTEGNRLGTVLQLDIGLWTNSAAITSIEIFPRYRAPHAYGTIFQQYSAAYLYGIKNTV